KAIKAEKAIAFADVDANMLTFWKVSIPVMPKKERKEISLTNVPSKEELDETDDVSDVFKRTSPKKTIHIIVQRPPPVHAPIAVPVAVRARSSTPFSDDSRPGTPLRPTC
ncbi:hypothetical protein BGZ83_011834, partial [Gryganskiella cystojenkinii]